MRSVTTLNTKANMELANKHAVLSCWWSEQIWRQVKTVISRVHNILQTEQFWPVLSAVWRQWQTSSSCKLDTGSRQDKTLFTPHFETGWNSFQFYILSQQCWLVANSIQHSALWNSQLVGLWGCRYNVRMFCWMPQIMGNSSVKSLVRLTRKLYQLLSWQPK